MKITACYKSKVDNVLFKGNLFGHRKASVALYNSWSLFKTTYGAYNVLPGIKFENEISIISWLIRNINLILRHTTIYEE